MKRIFLLSLLLSSALICYADDYYESNILGMMLKGIESPSAAENDWVLRVQKVDGGEETRFLEHNGELVSRLVLKTEGNNLIETKYEKESTTTVKKINGLVHSELLERADGSSELSEYSYKGRQLQSTVFFLDGVKIYTDNYYYADSGRLLDVFRDYGQNSLNIGISFVFESGRISRYWRGSEKQKNYIRFDETGIVFNEVFGSEGLNETREYIVLDGGKHAEVISNSSDGLTKRLVYDEDNRLLESIHRDTEGRIVEESHWIYKGEHLVEYRIRGELSLEVYRYNRADDGTLMKESYYKNGNLVQVIEYKSEKDFIETFYRNDTAVLKIEYIDGVRSSTVQLQER